ncbi:MAG: hypothetical protein DBX60_07855 [Bacillota bacterium]|nr:MAG: hypothetical protein DBX60_07855 [Bacillota bacterium]
MKKRHIAMLSLGALMACTLGLGVFTACDEGGGDAVKPSEYLDGINYYYGDGNDVHLQGWFVSENNDAWKVEEGVSDGGSTVTKLGFNKNTANNSFSVQIDGEYSDFKYLNITMRAEARGSDRAIAAHLSVANPIPQKDHLNVLGSDLYFDVSADVYTTYTFLVPSVSRQTLDVADYVRLAPDPGIQNTGTTLYTGDIYVKDCWFSKEAPADGVTPVDDTWRTEAWCGYTVTRGGADSEATISYEHPADWSRFYRPVPLEEVFLEDGTVNNMLRIRFTSDAVTVGDVTLEDSVEQFQVGLWGDPDPTSDAQFWQSWFGQYSSYGFANGSHSSAATMTVEKDEETGVITLTCQAAPALIGLAGNFEEQLWICFNLESQPQGGEPGGAPGYIAENTPFDGVGQMTILSSEFYYDETMPEYREPVENESGWSQNGVGAYVISSEKAGVMANVTFDNISPTAWSCLAYDASSDGKTVAVLTLRNNGSEKVLYGIDWNSEANRQYGFLEAGETKEVRLENASASGVINFFLDSCYDANDPSRLPDKEEYSGDVDIVSLTYEEGDAPVVPVTPGWSGAAVYTVSEKDGITNVVYEGIAPSGWTCIAYDTADANGKTAAVLTIRNNGTEKVLYGIDWNDQNARVYGFLEAGETKEVRVENASASGNINFFIDSCYDANDPTRLPEKDSYSGNVDILSLVYADGPAPVVPSDSAWTGAAIYTVSEKDGVTNVTYEGVGPQDWTCIAYGVTDEIRRPVVFLTLRNNGEKKMLYGIDLDNVDARVYGYLEPGEIRQLRLESAEAYTVINFFIDSCYDGTPYESYKDSYSGDIDILALEFAAEDEVIDITANTAKVFPTGRVKLTWKAANGADVTVSCTKDGAPAEDMTPVFGEYMTITELGTYVFTFEADGAVTAVWVVRCVERPIYVPDPEPDPEPETEWVDSGTGSFDLTPASDGSVQVTYPEAGPAEWSCIAYDAPEADNYLYAVVTLRNDGAVRVLYGIDWNDQNARVYGFLEAGETVSVEVRKPNTRSAAGPINVFIDSCYDAGYKNEKPTSFSGKVTILSVEYSNESTAPESPWTANSNHFTADGNTITFEGLPIGSWTGVTQSVSLTEAGTYVLSVTNNSDHWMKFKLNLQDENGAQIGLDSDPCVCWMEIPAGETYELKFTVTQEQAASARSMLLMIDCWATDNTVTETGEPCPEGPYSGSIETGELTLKEQPEQPEEPDDPDDQEPEVPAVPVVEWKCGAFGHPYTFINNDGTWTIEYANSPQWTNMDTAFVYTAQMTSVLKIPVTNNNDFVIKVRFDTMKNDENGVWVTLLQGNEVEIPAKGSVTIELQIDAGSEVAGLLGFVDMYGTQAGSISIAPLIIEEASAPEVPSEEDITASLTFEKAVETDPTTINGTTLSWENLTVGSWDAGFKAEYDLDDYRLAIVINIRNTSNHIVRFYAAARTADWGDSAFGETRVVAKPGESVVLTISLTGEQSSQVGLIVLYGELWETWDTESYDQRPTDENGDYLTTVSGSMEIVSVKVS